MQHNSPPLGDSVSVVVVGADVVGAGVVVAEKIQWPIRCNKFVKTSHFKYYFIIVFEIKQ